jgi:biotin synthase
MTNLKRTLQRALEGVTLTHGEAIMIMNLPDAQVDTLLDSVFEIRKRYKGLAVGIQLLTNAKSGDCSQNCAYCAQSHESKADIDKYRLVDYGKLSSDGAVIDDKKLSRHCIGLSGLRFSDKDIDEFAGQVAKLKGESKVPICCSIGFLTKQQAIKLKEAGVDRINHNLNSSRRHYPNICSTHTYDERIANIKMLQGLGFEICCGGIIGMGEDIEDIVDMLFDIRAINPESVPVNFLIPQTGTRLEDADTSHLTPAFCLKVLSLARLLIQKSDIRCAAGREVYLKGHEKDMFKAVDSIFASGYLTADGQNIDDTIRLVEESGFEYYIESN